MAALLCALSAAQAEPCRASTACSEQREELRINAAVHVRRERESSPLAHELLTAADEGQRKPTMSGVEMPWIWQQLRRTAYRHLPRKRIDRFDATFAPTVVSSGFDTVAGAGVRGRF
jgi:hypothetical protein